MLLRERIVVARHHVAEIRFGIGVEYGYINPVGAVEVDGGDGIEFSERLLYGSYKNLPYRSFVFEFNLAFGRMDVDVDGLRVDLEVQKV